MLIAMPRQRRCLDSVDALVKTIASASPRNQTKLLAMQLQLFKSASVTDFFEKQYARIQHELRKRL